MANHSLTIYYCLSCQEEYSAHQFALPRTEPVRGLLGHCWACCFVDSLSYSKQDFYLAGLEEEMDHIDFTEGS